MLNRAVQFARSASARSFQKTAFTGAVIGRGGESLQCGPACPVGLGVLQMQDRRKATATDATATSMCATTNSVHAQE